ncbi:MAG: PEP-CTERM sorting domain-containing protein [Desulfobacteraceae bacterium]|jgi:hypothetical protein
MGRILKGFGFLIVFLLMGLFLAVPAFAYTIDGNVDDWGVYLTDSGADEKPYLNTHLPSGGNDIDYFTEDNADKDDGNFYVNPGYSGSGNMYDAEAIYFDNDGTYGYIAIITGTSASDPYGPGDIAIDFGSGGEYGYEYGIDIFTHQLIQVTDWQNVAYTQHGVSNPYAINSGSYIGDVNLVYSSEINDHYVIEASFLLSDLGLTAGDTFGLHWTMRCGNDEVDLTADINPVPEPATMLLLGTGLVSLAGFRRKFKKS